MSNCKRRRIYSILLVLKPRSFLLNSTQKIENSNSDLQFFCELERDREFEQKIYKFVVQVLSSSSPFCVLTLAMISGFIKNQTLLGSLNMAIRNEKQVIEIEYSQKGGLKNVFVQVGNKPICLICNNAVSGLKKCNIARHYFTARASAYVKYKDLFRRDKSHN